MNLREGAAPQPAFEVYFPSLDGLDEICVWLGTFRERLRQARDGERDQVVAAISQLEVRYRERRAELS